MKSVNDASIDEMLNELDRRGELGIIVHAPLASIRDGATANFTLQANSDLSASQIGTLVYNIAKPMQAMLGETKT